MTFERIADEWLKAKKAGDKELMAHWRNELRKILSPADVVEFLGREADE